MARPTGLGAHGFPPGTIRDWGGGRMRKQPDGTWVPAEHAERSEDQEADREARAQDLRTEGAREVVLYRAAAKAKIDADNACFTPDREAAEIYRRDRPGRFGGQHLYQVKVRVDPREVLDLTRREPPEWLDVDPDEPIHEELHQRGRLERVYDHGYRWLRHRDLADDHESDTWISLSPWLLPELQPQEAPSMRLITVPRKKMQSESHSPRARLEKSLTAAAGAELCLVERYSDIGPDVTEDDSPCIMPVHPVLLGKSRVLPSSRGVLRAHSAHEILGEFGVPDSVAEAAAGRYSSSFGPAVPNIVPRSAQEKVGGVHTVAYVASVADHQPGRDFLPVCRDPGNSVGLHGNGVLRKIEIPVTRPDGAVPQPAVIGKSLLEAGGEFGFDSGRELGKNGSGHGGLLFRASCSASGSANSSGRFYFIPNALLKSQPHKYLRRLPTGKDKPRWRYWYKVPGQGIVQHDRIVEGSRYAAAHEGQAGHWHVLSSDDSGVFVKHTATGTHRKVSHEDFAKEVNAQHASAHQQQKTGKRAEILSAIKVLSEGGGGATQPQRVARLVEQAEKQGWIGAKEAAMYRARTKAEVEAHQASEGGKVRQALASLPKEHQAAVVGQMRQLEEARTRAEGADVGGKKDGGLGIAGDTAVMFVSDPSGKPRKQEIRYRLVPVEDLIASHLPRERFKENPAYPEGVQERTYHSNEEQQRKVERNAKGLEPDFLINTNPDAANGAPIMFPNGVVPGGNSRTMTLDLVYGFHPESEKKYTDTLRARAKQFGFSAADVDRIKHPVLVREVEDPGTKEGRVELVRKYNQSFTREMNPREEMVAKGKLLQPKSDGTDSFTYQALDRLGKNAEGKDIDETFNDFLTSSRSAEVVKAMRKDGLIDDVNQDRYTVKGDPTRLNEEGRLFVSKALLGSVIDNVADLEDMGQETRNQFNQNLPTILAAGRSNKAFDLVPALHRAAGHLAAMKRAGITNPLDAAQQDSLVDKKGKETADTNPIWHDPLAQSVTLAILGGKSAGPKFREFARIAAQPSSAGGMFDDGPTDEERANQAMKQAFGYQTDHPFKEHLDRIEAAARSKKLIRRNVETTKKLKAKGVKTQAETAQEQQEQVA